MKYAFIATHQAEFDIQIMCRVLQVSGSGYYAWRQRPVSPGAQANQNLLAQIKQVHADSRHTYGSRRVTAALQQQAVVCNRKRVARLMRLAQLQGCRRGKRRFTTTQVHPGQPVAANLLQQDFSASAPNQKWLGDITYIPTQEGFLYLASLEDVFSRKIVGWAMADSLQSRLVECALHMALLQRQPTAALLHHSDRGSQYTSADYRRLLAQHHSTVSMSSSGNCYDNAMKESFFATLKSECVTRLFATRLQARVAIFDYIEVFYNRQRLHSALGYRCPEQFELLFPFS
jgi:putative transposase